MMYTIARRCAVAWILVLLMGSQVRADHIEWTSYWIANPTAVKANDPGDGSIRFSYDQKVQHLTDSSSIILANLRTISNRPASNPAHFTDAPFDLILFIHDTASNLLGAMTFTGVFNGSLSKGNASIAVRWTGPETQTLHLGQHLFTVSLNPVTPPGPPDSSNLGSISANVKVMHNPEPASMILALLGAPLLATCWRLRQGRKGLAGERGL
jgi:hypothetical protein